MTVAAGVRPVTSNPEVVMRFLPSPACPGAASRLALLFLLASVPGVVAAASLEGRVTAFPSGEPLAYADVRMPDLGRRVLAGADGVFRLENVPPGTVRVEVSFVGYATHSAEVPVRVGQEARLEVALHEDPIALPPLRITADRRPLAGRRAILDKSYPARVFTTDGWFLVRRGSDFAGDLYADGFKRGDLTLTIDGERYPNACPNRMDPPATRLNPLEMASVELDKGAAAPSCGLGGGVTFHRETPSGDWRMQGSASSSRGASDGEDVAVALDGRGFRGTGRWAHGGPYEDADGRDFATLYGYREIVRHEALEFSVYGTRGGWAPGAGFARTRDVLFPYLQMDERENDLWSAHVSRWGAKLYANHTYHVMDNGLRTGPMFMETVARNTTVGAVGDGWEGYYRGWDADNRFVMPMGRIDNHLMPDVHLGHAAFSRSWRLGNAWEIGGLVGVEHQWPGDPDRLAFHRRVHEGAGDRRTFVPFGATLGWTKPIGPVSGSVTLEVASRAPEAEQLWISVAKPEGKPSWTGNPELDAPRRATIRVRTRARAVALEAFGTYVADHVSLVRAMAGGRPWLTFGNVDARLLGVNLDVEHRWAELHASYHSGQNVDRGGPLAEVQPLQGACTLKAPLGPWTPWARYTAAASQERVDVALGEARTPAWDRLDLGVRYARRIQVVAELENVTNELYSQHLSYLRDPFASGTRVWEPGRTFRIGLGASY